MKKLPQSYTGGYGQTMKQVKRTEKVAMYKDENADYYEVFKIFTRKAQKTIGIDKPHREIIPPLCYFGDRMAYSVQGSKRAHHIYEMIMGEISRDVPSDRPFIERLNDSLNALI